MEFREIVSSFLKDLCDGPKQVSRELNICYDQMKNYLRKSYTDDTMKSKVNKERDRVSKKNGLTWRIRETIKSVDLKKSTSSKERTRELQIRGLEKKARALEKRQENRKKN